MPLGPFDSRTKRSRCSPCSVSHLKCSGHVPCNNCARRRIACTYPSSNASSQQLILVESGKRKNTANWSSNDSGKTRTKTKMKTTKAPPQHGQHELSTRPAQDARLASPQHLIDQTTTYMSFFDTFTRRNNFTGRQRTAGDEVKQLTELHSRKGNHIFNAMLAVGAMYAGQPNSGHSISRRDALSIALQYYSYSIQGLQEALDAIKFGARTHLRKNNDQRVCILWTTLFLGLFELMNDATGHGWQQHIIHGTSMALEASGPDSCRSGPGLAFFMQARIFEISRTILFNEPTFLTRPDWLALSRDASAKEDSASGSTDSSRPLDSLLDIMVMCSNLRVRAETFVHAEEAGAHETTKSEAVAISEDGHLLREALASWSAAYTPDMAQPSISSAESPMGNQESTGHDYAADPSTLLARVFYPAISIYLSGVFDYELSHWRRLKLTVPTLDAASILHHVHAILALTELGLDCTNLSPVLFLFPLRIAGARSCYQWQRIRVRALVDRIGDAFAVASTISNNLSQVWEKRPTIPPLEPDFT